MHLGIDPGPYRIVVRGEPKPAGSKSAFPVMRNGKYVHAENGRPIISVADACRGGKKWKSVVAKAAKEQWKSPPLEGPVRLTVNFFMPRPKDHYRSGKFAGQLKPDAPQYHVSKPDTTKLLRAVEDALTGIVWCDDSKVVFQVASKNYAGECNELELGFTGAIITVDRIRGG